MDPHAGKIVLNGAPSQLTRLLSSPGAARARVDGRGQAELLAFASRFGALVNFYNLENEVEGDWSAFFLADPAVVAAALEGAAPAQREAAVAALARRTVETADPEEKRALLGGLFAAPHALARQADAWLGALDRLPRGGAAERARRQLTAAVRGTLAPGLRRLRGWDQGAAAREALGAPVGLNYAGFGDAWEVEGARPDASIFRGAGEADRMDAAVPPLVETFTAFHDALAPVAAAAAEVGLAAEQLEGQRRPPAVLYDAFVRLFRTAQDSLDTLTPRYASFYYRDVLRERERGPVPDSVYLAFALEADDAAPAAVPAATQFPAGSDPDGHEVVYAADRGVTVTAASLARVRMLRAVAGPLIVSFTPTSPVIPPVLPPTPPPSEVVSVTTSATPVRDDGGDAELAAVQQVLASYLAGADGAEAVGEAGAGGDPWPTFGANAEGTVGRLATAPATLGFAVATPELLLTGGRRSVAVTLGIGAGEALAARLSAVALAVDGAAEEEDQLKVLEQVVNGAFTLSLSTADGWFVVEGYCARVQPGTTGQAVTLVVDLPSAVPAIVPLYQGGDPPPPEEEDPETAANPAPTLPTLKAYLRAGTVPVTGPLGTALVYPFSFLDAVSVSAVEVSTQVCGLADLALANTDGEVDPGSPFPVFGGSPAVGSYLEMRSVELFSKRPTELSLTVRWLGLPPNDTGFAGWYRDYRIGLDGKPQCCLFDNTTFRGRVRVVSPGAWEVGVVPTGGEVPFEPVYLFRTRAASAVAATPVAATPVAATAVSATSVQPVPCGQPVPCPREPGCDGPPPRRSAPLCAESSFDPLTVTDTKGLPAYYDPSESALRLELSDPPYAFGNDLYAANVLNAVLEDLPDTSACQDTCLAACQPLATASAALAACQAECEKDPTLCTTCVQGVLDALVASAVELLEGCCLSPVLRTQARGVLKQPPAERLATLQAVVRAARAEVPAAGPCLRRCARMVICAVSLQACLTSGTSGGGTSGGGTTGGGSTGGGTSGGGSSTGGTTDGGTTGGSTTGGGTTGGSTSGDGSSTGGTTGGGSTEGGSTVGDPSSTTSSGDTGTSGDTGSGDGTSTGSSGDGTSSGTSGDGGSGGDPSGGGSSSGGSSGDGGSGSGSGDGGSGGGTTGGPTAECITACRQQLDAAYTLSLQECMDDCVRLKGELRYPNEPYLPQAESVTVNYAAECTFSPGASDACGEMYHLEPFGGWRAAVGADGTAALLPPVAAPGTLLLGFSGLAQAQTLTLLFQLAAAGGTDEPPPPPSVSWSYRSANQWNALPPAAVVDDGTHGLRNSGIVTLALPRMEAQGDTVLPGGERWLRAAAHGDPDGAAWTVSIHPHALAATWVNTGDGTGAHMAAPLPAGTITASVESLPGIGTITQPMPSFGGRPPETGETFQVRVGERLRHKDRAVQPWDYERLVLERFPQVWKVGVLPARSLSGADPGSVVVVVVAGQEGNESADATVPRAPGALLGQVHDYLAARASPFVRLEVVNPVYVRVTVEAEVVFRRGAEGGDIDRLNADLVAWLSPWFYDAGRAARQGRYAYESDISEFIQTRPYVDTLLSLALRHEPPPGTREWYFLTSAPAHVIRERVPGMVDG
jgi:hypothetical protein